ncbi:MAG: endolytic transglycosylase MltG [Rhodobacteraceae bacterium]|nr:MAG: endolytic transglycosylase MltG [Paracoccaceae bacterium]
MRNLASSAITLIIVLGVAIAGLAAWGERTFRGPGPLETEAVFEVPRGATLDRVAEKLEAEGVIASARVFRVGARLDGGADRLRFGEFAIPARASMEEVLDVLRSGRVILHFVTVPEGRTSHEAVAILNASPVLTGEIEEIPPEGSLAPETFAVQRGDTRASVIARMTEMQRRILEEAWAARNERSALRSPEEALILASIIERETAVRDELERVSAVFHNRLRRGMRLQSDPTIIYGLTRGEGPLGRALTRADIESRTPWNTYVIDGLPPTPIANPGRAAIFAATQPIESDEYYFVADGTGGHAFARTLAEHNRNVAAWRAIERERASQ